MISRNSELDKIWKADADLKTNIASIFKNDFTGSRRSSSARLLSYDPSIEYVRRDILQCLDRLTLNEFYTKMYWSDLQRQLPAKHHIPVKPSPVDDIDEKVLYVLHRMVESIPDLAKLDKDIVDRWNNVILGQGNHEPTNKSLSN